MDRLIALISGVFVRWIDFKDQVYVQGVLDYLTASRVADRTVD